MEKKSAQPKRDPSRLEKIREFTNTKVSRMEKLKQAFKSQTFWVIIITLTTLGTMKNVIKPWYDQKRLTEAEEYANFLWEKSQKKSTE